VDGGRFVRAASLLELAHVRGVLFSVACIGEFVGDQLEDGVWRMDLIASCFVVIDRLRSSRFPLRDDPCVEVLYSTRRIDESCFFPS